MLHSFVKKLKIIIPSAKATKDYLKEKEKDS
jgi:hypothetical protein